MAGTQPAGNGADSEKAGKQFIGNVMAGLMLRAVRNFRTGDFVRVEKHFGRVTERGLLHTEIQTEDPVVDLYVYGGWAEQVRFRNEEGDWSSWQNYAADITWALSAGNGQKTVHAELKNGSQVRTSVDQIHLTGQEAIGVPEEPANTTDSIAGGAEIFREACAKCHGPTGRGDGKSQIKKIKKEEKDCNLISFE